MTHSDHHRHCLILRGTSQQLLSEFLNLSRSLNTPLICSQQIEQYDKLNQGLYQTCNFKQARQLLGSTQEAVLIDLSQGVSASALAILAGTVRGGGLFALGLPNGDWHAHLDQDLSRYLPWPYQTEHVHSYFKDYLWSRLQDASSPFKESGEQQTPFMALPVWPQNITLTSQQQQAQNQLLKLEADHYILTAARGRGKSTMLGDTLAKLSQSSLKLALVAPNQDAIGTLKAQFEHSLQQHDSSAKWPFYAADALLSNSQHWDVLVVDEAAMFPIPMLIELASRAKHCVFSTTDYGYEGIGKGFSMRFTKHLKQLKSRSQQGVAYLKLEHPIRWGKNDPLEAWLNNTFFLGGDIASEPLIESPIKSLQYQALSAKDWLQQPAQLSRAFQLLANAHYQTSADNLRWMLDDPSLSIHTLNREQDLLSLAIVSAEGGLSDSLNQAVMEGKRRPRGHLVPQSLLAHEGLAEAGQLNYWRISRIATQPTQHNLGYGSQLLEKIAQSAPSECDFLCTSFAATPDVLHFWLKNGYRIVRLGTSKDHASGSYSIMMVKPLNQSANTICTGWQNRFIEQFTVNLMLQYHDLASDVVLQILAGNNRELSLPSLAQLNPQERHELALFIGHHKPFDSIRPVFLKACYQLAINQQLDVKNPRHLLMLEAALGRDLSANQKKAQLDGKKAIYQTFKSLLKVKTGG
ncbi:GNAT family N-acetyltransferase [Marinomonas aquiplantarum]|uniref:tRNA(Met) cytidine acetyltransferase TmcA n=1 Tax=Marinomonas aquiplantarum TaxID=491951 RepID=A0A366D483_9GAMM|nr:GNAT family N-acetyltransferase [Marinomonas aquiplantarum]RBO84776.1 tRNA(Met)-cytidine N(4)-acetyltransferase [Marinomonas aquiplantarum]